MLVSGFTVMAAMAGMFLAGDRTFTALGVGSIMVVAVAMIGSVTVVPGRAVVLGDRVEKGRVPFLGTRCTRDDGESRVWNAVLDARPAPPGWSSALGRRPARRAGDPRVLACTPRSPGTDDLPRKLAGHAASTTACRPRSRAGRSRPSRGHRGRRRRRRRRSPRRSRTLERRAVGDRHVQRPGRRDGQPPTSTVAHDRHADRRATAPTPSERRAWPTLRGDVVPQTVGKRPGVERAYVTGMTAETKDFNDLMKGRAPLVFAFVLGLAFLLLLVTFRSIVIPIKAIVLNLLSVGAAYGVLTWVFQDGPPARSCSASTPTAAITAGCRCSCS